MERELKNEKIWIKLKNDKLDARNVEEFTVQPDCGRGLKFGKALRALFLIERYF